MLNHRPCTADLDIVRERALSRANLTAPQRHAEISKCAHLRFESAEDEEVCPASSLSSHLAQIQPIVETFVARVDHDLTVNSPVLILWRLALHIFEHVA